MRERTSPPAGRGAGAELMQVVEQIGREKGIDVDVLVSALEDAITAASRKHQERLGPRASVQENLISRLDRATGEIRVYARKHVVEQPSDPALEIGLGEAVAADPGARLGGYVDLERPTKGLGRIEAQAAKEVISRKVREAEREIVYNEYSGRIGELVNGTVKRFERGDVVVELGRTEAVLPRRFQSRAEMFSQGDRVRGVIVEVTKLQKGPPVVLTRVDPLVVLKLFEMEVPEIYDGTVELRGAVREPGERAKIAVSSRARDVDPVGACVGLKGSRVQAIIRELRGEKVDIVQWAPELETYAANALNPARVTRVQPGPAGERLLEVVVDDQQLSLAIGKKGQNVRLAARLVGCRLEIRGDPERAADAAAVRRGAPLESVAGVEEGVRAALGEAGIKTASDVLLLGAEQVAARASLDVETAARIVAAVRAHVGPVTDSSEANQE